jgi:hypothetical protein
VECQGCDLNDLNAKSARKGRNPDSRLINIPCLFTDSHHNFINIKHLQPGFTPSTYDKGQTLCTSNLQISHQLREHFTTNNPSPIIQNHMIPPKITTETNLGLTFYHNNSHTPVNSPARSFTKDVMNAINFASLLSLERWQLVLFHHNQNSIDWDVTWRLLKHHNKTDKSSTSFAKSTLTSFSTKILLDEITLTPVITD